MDDEDGEQGVLHFHATGEVIPFWRAPHLILPGQLLRLMQRDVVAHLAEAVQATGKRKRSLLPLTWLQRTRVRWFGVERLEQAWSPLAGRLTVTVEVAAWERRVVWVTVAPPGEPATGP